MPENWRKSTKIRKLQMAENPKFIPKNNLSVLMRMDSAK